MTNKNVHNRRAPVHVSLVTQPGCAWTAVSNVDWIVVNTPAGTGSARLDFKVA